MAQDANARILLRAPRVMQAQLPSKQLYLQLSCSHALLGRNHCQLRIPQALLQR